MKKTKTTINKAICFVLTRFPLREIAKRDFSFGYIEKDCSKRKIVLHCTDSFIASIKTKDFFQDTLKYLKKGLTKQIIK